MYNIVYISHEKSYETLLGSSLSLDNLINSVKHECNIYVITPNKGATYRLFKSKGYNVYDIPFPLDIISKKNEFRNFLITIPKFIVYTFLLIKALIIAKQILQDKHIHIVHSNSSVVDYGFYLSKVLNCKHVWHLREFQNKDFSLRPFLGWRYLKNRIYKSDYSIAITQPVSSHWGCEKHSNHSVVGDAVRKKTDSCLVLPKDKFFVFCGNIVSSKSPDDAIKAFALFCIKIKNPEYKLLLVGGYKEEYKNQLLQLVPEINNRIYFCGFQDDVKTIVSHASALLMCSKNEGLGRVTIEAMFYGCPVVGYNNAGTKIIIRHEINGLLYDTIEQCSQQMYQIVTDSNLSKSLINAAQKYAIENYSEEVYGSKVLDIYKKILN